VALQLKSMRIFFSSYLHQGGSGPPYWVGREEDGARKQ
jgi:hypothetical protein